MRLEFQQCCAPRNNIRSFANARAICNFHCIESFGLHVGAPHTFHVDLRGRLHKDARQGFTMRMIVMNYREERAKASFAFQIPKRK